MNYWGVSSAICPNQVNRALLAQRVPHMEALLDQKIEENMDPYDFGPT